MSLNKFTNFERSSQASMNIQAESLKTEEFVFKPTGSNLSGKVLEIEDEEGNVIAVDPTFNKNTYSNNITPSLYSIPGSTTTPIRITPYIQVPFTNFTYKTMVKLELMGSYLTNNPQVQYEPLKIVLSGPTGDLWDYTYITNPADNSGGLELPAVSTPTPTTRGSFKHEIYIRFDGYKVGQDNAVTTYGQSHFYGTSTQTPVDLPKRYTAISNYPITYHANVINLLPTDGFQFSIHTANSGNNAMNFSVDLTSLNITLSSY